LSIDKANYEKYVLGRRWRASSVVSRDVPKVTMVTFVVIILVKEERFAHNRRTSG